MQNFESRIMPYVRQKVANDDKEERKRKEEKKKQMLFRAYEELDKIFGKPLSAFQIVTVLSFRERHEKIQIIFIVDDFTFRFRCNISKWSVEFHTLHVLSKAWYRRWYNTEYSARKFMKLVEDGKI